MKRYRRRFVGNPWLAALLCVLALPLGVLYIFFTTEWIEQDIHDL